MSHVEGYVSNEEVEWEGERPQALGLDRAEGLGDVGGEEGLQRGFVQTGTQTRVGSSGNEGGKKQDYVQHLCLLWE